MRQTHFYSAPLACFCSALDKHIRTAHPVAQVNEALCKLLCHNIVVLIHERYKNGIEPDYSLVEELKLFDA